MEQNDEPLRFLDENVALRTILEGTATATGQQFFAALVQNLAKALNTHGAWVTEFFEERRMLRARAFWMDGNWLHDYEFDIAGTPCEEVIRTGRLVHVPENLWVAIPISKTPGWSVIWGRRSSTLTAGFWVTWRSWIGARSLRS